MSDVIWYVNALKLGKRENNINMDFNGARNFDSLAHFVQLPEREEKDVKDKL